VYVCRSMAKSFSCTFCPSRSTVRSNTPVLFRLNSKLMSLYTYTHSPSMATILSPVCKPPALSSGQPSAKPEITG